MVRVVPRSGRTRVELVGGRVVVRTRAAPEGGNATEEARRALARALGQPLTAVSLRHGRRSREKVFEVAGVTEEQALQQLQGR